MQAPHPRTFSRDLHTSYLLSRRSTAGNRDGSGASVLALCRRGFGACPASRCSYLGGCVSVAWTTGVPEQLSRLDGVVVFERDVEARPPDADAAVALSGGALALSVALGELDGRLADMYVGARTVLGHLSNPDRLSLAAHGLRELMEKLPRHLDVPVEVSKGPGLNSLSRDLVDAWRKWGPRSSKDDGSLRNPAKVFAALETFCVAVEADLPTRKEQAAAALRGLDLHPVKLPPSIESLHVSQWRDLEGFFQGVSHHTHVSTPDEFAQYLGALERFLLDRLRPRTFDDLAAIDALLAEDA
jgi:hypothetical protein